ncbi:MAG TPA: hypothetical protein VE981_04660 [Planctomycetota bacterium]|nr:hypothetical protein [Planctomycetota bacterium]
MSSKRAWVWTGRLTALLAAVIIPACGQTGSPGGANPNGIIWNSQGTTGAGQGGTGGPGGGLWVDPNSGLGATPIGISNIISSADDATYDAYFPGGLGGLSASRITYIQGNLHPLSTDTGSTAITTPENGLQQQINAYRNTTLGNVNVGNGGGGLAVGNTQGIILGGHLKGTKSARAHCKHFALGHPQLAFVATANPEGDALRGGNAILGTPPNPDGDKGRLGKINVTSLPPSAMPDALVVSGTAYGDYGAAFTFLVTNYRPTLTAMGWSSFAVGHWRGGPKAYYWHVFFLTSPTPAN